MNYKQKYLKYKLKYLTTKNLYGGMEDGSDQQENARRELERIRSEEAKALMKKTRRKEEALREERRRREEALREERRRREKVLMEKIYDEHSKGNPDWRGPIEDPSSASLGNIDRTTKWPSPPTSKYTKTTPSETYKKNRKDRYKERKSPPPPKSTSSMKERATSLPPLGEEYTDTEVIIPTKSDKDKAIKNSIERLLALKEEYEAIEKNSSVKEDARERARIEKVKIEKRIQSLYDTVDRIWPL